ncbi:MAG: hypothetical protein LIP03_05765 [Bacteroidales bacterium]|nr:hypothetical protein [Bacteroidales bacterium]
MIEERLTPGRGVLMPAQQAYFRVKHMPPGRYHVRYNSQKTGLFAAFPLHITPGLRASRELGR